MSVKDCGYHKYERRKLLRRIFAGVLGFIVLVLLVILLIWVILRPTKPRFLLQDVTVHVFNVSTSGASPSPTSPTPNTVTVTMQATLLAHNPNDQIGVYYQNLDVYASYRNQQISLATVLPPTYQDHNDDTVWSPFLCGNAVPVSPYVLSALQQDQSAGGMLVNVKVNGRVKWKVGTWTSGRYHLYVNCPAYIRFPGDPNMTIGVVGTAIKFQILQSCSVDV
ncbi:hypothetical protein L6164_022156 [Bauhinia variegata]|uniref:Uncharacterized protein n=1 Tax=Bauhinia variegata TaxID=167791 RepID=A0ACB9MEQ8_BAUVA|nr:hypothetical protein L6164_022156 [Bauhinia variegata]